MQQDSPPSKSAKPDGSGVLARRQVTLKTLLVVMTCLSVFFAIAGSGDLGVAETMLLVASFGASIGVGVGLCQQARDIGKLWCSSTSLDAAEKRSLRFEKSWRYLLAGFVFAYWFFSMMDSQGVFGEHEEPDDFTGFYLEVTLRMLPVTIGIATPLLSIRPCIQGLTANIVHWLGWLGGAMLFVVFLLRDTSVIGAMVHVAIRGITVAYPLPGGETFSEGEVVRYAASVHTFSCAALGLGTLIVVNVAMLVWMTSRRRNWLSCAGYISSLIAALAVAWWMRAVGFPSVSPLLAETKSFWLPDVWHLALPLLVLFVAAASRRLIGRGRSSDGNLTWRPEGRIYWSESWIVLGLAIASPSVSFIVYDIWELSGFFASPFDTLLSLLWGLEYPPYCANLALAAASLHVLILRLRRVPLPGEAPSDFRVFEFISICVAVLMTTYVTLEACIWGSFAYWIRPEELLWPSVL